MILLSISGNSSSSFNLHLGNLTLSLEAVIRPGPCIKAAPGDSRDKHLLLGPMDLQQISTGCRDVTSLPCFFLEPERVRGEESSRILTCVGDVSGMCGMLML